MYQALLQSYCTSGTSGKERREIRNIPIYIQTFNTLMCTDFQKLVGIPKAREKHLNTTMEHSSHCGDVNNVIWYKM